MSSQLLNQMLDLDVLTPEERFEFGSWLYYISEGWKDPEWWEKRPEFAKKTGHVMTVKITAP